MNKKEDRQDLISKIKKSKNLFELKSVHKEINEFLKKYGLSQDSEDFKKLKNVFDLIKIKLKNRGDVQNENVVKLNESQLLEIIRRVINYQK